MHLNNNCNCYYDESPDISAVMSPSKRLICHFANINEETLSE